WFTLLAYAAVLWANLTALSLVGRGIFGDLFKQGYLYTIAGYDIYWAEAVIQIIVLVITGLLCIYTKRLASVFQLVFAVMLVFGVLMCFLFTENTSIVENLTADKISLSKENLRGILSIIILTPWAFVGFESISNSAEEFKFPVKKTFCIMLLSIIIGAVSYIFLTIVTAIRSGYTVSSYIDSSEFVANIENSSILDLLNTIGGNTGVIILSAAFFSAVFTGIIGMYISLSRLVYEMAKDGIISPKLSELGENFSPKKAIFCIMAISAIIPFLGKSAMNWLMDATTIGTIITYGYTSAAAYKSAKKANHKKIEITGIIGIIISFIFVLIMLMINLISINSISAESYLLLTFCSILGILYFRLTFRNDTHGRFGHSTVVWLVLLFLIFFTSLMWMRQVTHTKTETVVQNLNERYIEELKRQGVKRTNDDVYPREEAYLSEQMDIIRVSLLKNNFFQMGLIMLSFAFIFSIFAANRKREKLMEKQKDIAERNSRAKSIFLSNMSHDLRTPMNAIIGYINLAKDEDDPEKIRNYLSKIDISSNHLLSLINDILEMSRIESGKLVLNEECTDLESVMNDIKDIFIAQMQEKEINYIVDYSDISDRYAICDKKLFDRVLLNLISNAYKFTPKGGNISVILKQKNIGSQEYASYILTVKDNGIGMTQEFARKIFETFERERSSTVSGIQGTGLGMAITKNILDIMGGKISFETEKGKGTEFTVSVNFKHCEPQETEKTKRKIEDSKGPHNFGGKRLLLVEDIDINRDIAQTLLGNFGFKVETATNGQEAVDMVASSLPFYYDAVLMDIQMPVMNGYEATKNIRSLGNKDLANTPIIAMTANAFSEDIQKAAEHGMNGHIAKPIDINAMVRTLKEVLNDEN
ncbi:MAG: amino acid permease, partial [Firmicutes bacterium]|nr:amino acid permease [Bacillota bacterium]